MNCVNRGCGDKDSNSVHITGFLHYCSATEACEEMTISALAIIKHPKNQFTDL